ncbi:MAG: ribonuclease PH [Candidatus Omnitrophica bacterium]|nr:ribonuclease PH [Candidatus Omnitrophota bacterium]MBU1090855.1 ribonuclease PH [Candidatus Omnitrophota bacterium]MBU1906203.1 ribonuclease PH [Candidatus Omnitrophota bacterium]
MNRGDGRKADQLRKIKITPDYIKYAEGSCLIELGNTRIICTASVEESVPNFLKNTGTGWVTAEYGLLPRSCKSRIPRGKNSGRTHEIQRLLGRSLRVVTDLKKIGERTIWLDCDVIQADGGTRTTSITGSFIALSFALHRLKQQKIIDKIPVKDFVAATSVGISGKELLLDLTYEEDYKTDVDMNIVMTGSGEFIEIQGTAEKKTFNKEQMDGLIVLARKGIEELVEIQRSYLKDIL